MRDLASSARHGRRHWSHFDHLTVSVSTTRHLKQKLGTGMKKVEGGGRGDKE